MSFLIIEEFYASNKDTFLLSHKTIKIQNSQINVFFVQNAIDGSLLCDLLLAQSQHIAVKIFVAEINKKTSTYRDFSYFINKINAHNRIRYIPYNASSILFGKEKNVLQWMKMLNYFLNNNRLQQIEETLNIKLHHLLQSSLENMSADMKQRFVLMISFFDTADVIFMNEPFQHISYHDSHALLLWLQKEKKTVIWITTDVRLASKFADNFFVFKQNTMLCSYTRDEIQKI